MIEDLERERPDAIWCLGDLVGYGPRPNDCCHTVRERADLSLVGNHDLVVLGAADVDDFNPDAGFAAEWTRRALSKESREYLSGLEPSAVRENVELYHGSPRDAVWDYVLDGEAVTASFALTTAPFVLIGHSHIPIVGHLDDERVEAAHAPEGTEETLDGGRLLLNPGSVGQPRDGDACAAWLLLDLDAGRASFRRVPYPVERTQQEMRDAGLPEALAERLAHGL